MRTCARWPRGPRELAETRLAWRRRPNPSGPMPSLPTVFASSRARACSRNFSPAGPFGDGMGHRISFVIPAFNEARYLPHVLDSLDAAKQNFRHGAGAVAVIVAVNVS